LDHRAHQKGFDLSSQGWPALGDSFEARYIHVITDAHPVRNPNEWSHAFRITEHLFCDSWILK
jgi:hypothetical protein